MKESLLKISEYVDALEQRLADIDRQMAETKATIEELTLKNTELEKRIAELEARPVPETEIEMDWLEEEPEASKPLSFDEEPAQEQQEQEVEKEEQPIIPEPQQTKLPEQQEISSQPEQPEIPAQQEQQVPPAQQEHPEAPAAKTQTKATPVADIRLAISLGDRFLFQRELFGQNGELMQKTLEALNNQPNLSTAMAYLDKNFDWDKDSPTYELFINALRRRLA